jgi:hypothetical protein
MRKAEIVYEPSILLVLFIQALSLAKAQASPVCLAKPVRQSPT